MADFGAPTVKPTMLVSNAASLAELHEWSVPCPCMRPALQIRSVCIKERMLGWMGKGGVAAASAMCVQTQRSLEPRCMTRRWVDERGNARWSGGPDLRSSQIYPQQFAAAAASCVKFLCFRMATARLRVEKLHAATEDPHVRDRGVGGGPSLLQVLQWWQRHSAEWAAGARARHRAAALDAAPAPAQGNDRWADASLEDVWALLS